MSSQSVALLGLQEPRVKVRPDNAVDFYDGDEAVELSAGYGLVPDPWQGDCVVQGWLARGRDGRLAAGRCGLAVPRQNGKNGSVEIAQLHKLVVQGRKILHTAHEVKTARKAFLRLCSFFENERKFPELAELVESIRRTNGQEAILLTNGASIEFVARSRGSARGFTVDDLFCDEAQELTDEQLEALLPTVSAAPSGDPQIIFLGTPPPPEASGEVFVRVRENALSGSSERLCWDEWSIPDEMPVSEALANWREFAFATNPALGRRLSLTTVADEVAAMSPEGFCRERLGQWQIAGKGANAFSRGRWVRLKADLGDCVRTAYGVKFTADGAGVALVAAFLNSDGSVFVEPIKQANLGEGVQWLVDELVDLAPYAAQIVIDGKSGVGYLVNALRDAGIKNKRLIILPTLDQVIAAHSMFEQEFIKGTVSHGGDSELARQVEYAKKRKIGNNGGFGYEAPEGETVVSLDAALLAVWGVKTTRRRPGKGSKVSV